MTDTVVPNDRRTEVLNKKLETLRAEVARLRRIEAIAAEFCARCERGEIRSTSTYARFMAALREGPSRLA
jgi:hypothetical protein